MEKSQTHTVYEGLGGETSRAEITRKCHKNRNLVLSMITVPDYF